MLNEEDIEILLEALELFERQQDRDIGAATSFSDAFSTNRLPDFMSGIIHDLDLEDSITEKANMIKTKARANKEKATFVKAKLYELRNKIVAQEGIDFLQNQGE